MSECAGSTSYFFGERTRIEGWFVRVAVWFLGSAAIALAAAGCSRQTATLASAPPQPAPGRPQVTLASWYGPGFVGRPTSSGEIYDQNALTAASRTLPLGSRVRVTNLANGKSVVVRINDRGPYVRGRGIDLSHGAAQQIGLARQGVGTVRISRLDEPPGASGASWSGPVRIRRFRPVRRGAAHRRYASAKHSRRMVANPVGEWLLEIVTPPHRH